MSTDTYLPTIGLEIHAELKTRTKMFCDSKNDSDEKKPNANICPVCTAHPGTLPVINKAAVKHVLSVGAAISGSIASYTEFDRKNYFYPDIPKGYQISQYKYPLVKGGSLRGVSITRVHLEEDTARSSHETGESSLVDYNRAGVPLMELVTEPVIHGAKDASAFARELQLLLRTLGASDANMEKGEMRVEANISVGKDGIRGTKVEVKNLNSFKAVERAIDFELQRQIRLVDRGGKVLQETRGWDETKGETYSQRVKEDSHDYRYFPDPDLPKLDLSKIDEFSTEMLKKELPELPQSKRERYLKLGLRNEDADLLAGDLEKSIFFDEVVKSETKEYVLRSANYILTDVAGLASEHSKNSDKFSLGKLSASAFKKLMEMSLSGRLSSRGVKDILAILYKEGGDPQVLAEENGLIQNNNRETLRIVVEEIINTHPSIVAEYKNGKKSSLQFLIGQSMKLTKGSGNPESIKELLEELL